MFQQKEPRATPMAQLHELLGQLEVHIGKLEHDREEEVCKIPALFDAASTIIAELTQAGAPLSAEMVRFKTVSALFRRKAKIFLRKVGGTKAFVALREERHPEAAQWWWFIDQQVAAQATVRRRRQMKSLLLGALILAVLVGVYVLFLRPDAVTVERMQRQRAAEQLAQAGDIAAALAEVNAALTVAPDDASLLAFKGILQAKLGLEAAAATTFAAAEAAAESREHFFLIQAQIYLVLGMSDAALDNAQAAIATNPQSARGYLYLAQANANMGNLSAAQMQYDEAARLADEAGDVELAAIARVQKAYLYQQISPASSTVTLAP